MKAISTDGRSDATPPKNGFHVLEDLGPDLLLHRPADTIKEVVIKRRQIKACLFSTLFPELPGRFSGSDCLRNTRHDLLEMPLIYAQILLDIWYVPEGSI